MNKKNIGTNILLVIGALVFTLVLAELVLSAGSYFIYPRLSTTDRVLGWKYKPTAKSVRRYYNKDVVYTLSINKDGFRDDDFALGSDYFKIMLLGDSMTFAMEASQDEMFARLLENRLKDKFPGRKIDVMNFGITGFSTGQQLICLKEYAPVYKPAVVVHMLFEVNDFEDNFSYISAGRYRPHFVIESGNLVLVNNPTAWDKALSFMRDHTVLTYFLSARIPFTRRMLSDEKKAGEKEKIELLCRSVKEMSDYCRSIGAPLVVFYIRDENIPEGRFVAVSRYFKENGIDFGIVPLKPEERIDEIAHWNSKGHISVAGIIYDKLLRDGYLEPLARQH